MDIQSLFSSRSLTEKQKKKYLYTELDKRREKLKEEGCEGVDYKNKVYRTKLHLKREIKNGIIRRYRKPVYYYKSIFHKHILDNNLTHLFKTAQDINYTPPSSVRTHKEFANHITKQNLISSVFPAFKRFDKGGRQACIFISSNIGWISKDDKGYYRYCSKNEKTGIIFGFSLLDLIEISLEHEFTDEKQTYINTRNRLATILNCKYSEIEFEEQQKERYLNNLSIIDDIDTLKQGYPNLHSLIKSQVYVLKKLHSFAMANITEKQHAINKQAVFFVSTRTLQKNLEENDLIIKHPPTLAAAINLFAVLGLLYKIPSEIVKNNEFLHRIALKIQGDNKKYYLMNFMTIPHYDEKLFTKAERVAKKLKKNKITTAKDISRSSLIRVFGVKKANQIIQERSVMAKSANELYELAKLATQDMPDEAFNNRYSEMH